MPNVRDRFLTNGGGSGISYLRYTHVEGKATKTSSESQPALYSQESGSGSAHFSFSREFRLWRHSSLKVEVLLDSIIAQRGQRRREGEELTLWSGRDHTYTTFSSQPLAILITISLNESPQFPFITRLSPPSCQRVE